MRNDIIANMITCIRNANLNRTKTVEVPATHTTRTIARILFKEGYIESIRFFNKEGPMAFVMVLTLRYQRDKRTPCITTIRRISKPGLRVYSNYKHIPKVLGGVGIMILSTSQGIMIDREARQRQLGGEILCYVW